MEFLNELETMARVATQQSEEPDTPHHDDIKRWQSLFGLSYSQALREIQGHRSDLSRAIVSDSHWDIVRAKKEAEGFNKEAYEYATRFRAPKPLAIPTANHHQSYLLRLEGLIDNLAIVKQASQLTKAPPIFHGTDDNGNPVSFCKVDVTARNNIITYLSKHEPRFQPTFVPCHIAAKDLSTASAHPTLGIDATMPQFRLSSADDWILTPAQSQYPVWYFFYGTLADPTVLGRLLGVEPSYEDASVRGGILKTWGGKYKVLIDAPGGIVHGAAFLVQDQDQEDTLRCYETEKYEVVRCEIDMRDKKVKGLTFRREAYLSAAKCDAVGTFVRLWGKGSSIKILLNARYPRSNLLSSYDYVIVGAGTSGLTVADRLSADGKSTVLVIENGQIVDSPRISQVYSGVAAMGPTWSYQINSVRQPNLNNRSTSVVVGKLVGGSSAINAMMTIRGTSDDYDRWGSFLGNGSTWSWEGLLPYFKKIVDLILTLSEEAQFEAFRDIPGVEFPPDSGSGKAGVYWFPTFMDPERVERSYARTGHFDLINRTNFEVLTDSKVTKILLEGGVATGVSFEQKAENGTAIMSVKAKKEVIIAAGAIHSPQLLQRSGIGPSALLDSAGIETIVDLPGVGQNFHDHPMVFTNYVLQNFTVHPNPVDMYSNQNFSAWAQEVWRVNKTVIAPDTFEEIASKLEKLDHAALLPNGTDLTVIAGYKAQMKNMAAAIRSPNTAFYNHVLTGGSSSGTIVDLHPLSRGTVNINVTDPFASEPVVDYRALTNPVDLDIMVEILRFTKRYYFETRLRDLAPRQVQPPEYVNEPDDLKGFLRQNVNPSYFHPVGTCAMMPRELGGVVDERLEVYGVENLRVVDASIMPVLVGANTCQTTYAIAEKAADLIKADV
ncbi:hypothetical protein FHL15_008161 [Xylaria flabelliformis]|uniref:Glucose-methanol-choline oxidoreductase N-terminal domain-containing protein n=1 Tax=Xylaria flabelliformis TaxID=2512241 RepID=A0A553HSM5_9PEZI|nr:hypothetical protein FHL15_008161 [Xylaria flabelliformis]